MDIIGGGGGSDRSSGSVGGGGMECEGAGKRYERAYALLEERLLSGEVAVQPCRDDAAAYGREYEANEEGQKRCGGNGNANSRKTPNRPTGSEGLLPHDRGENAVALAGPPKGGVVAIADGENGSALSTAASPRRAHAR